MTDAGPASGTDATPRPPSTGLDGLIDQVAGFWKLTTRVSRRVLDGDYTIADATVDMDAWVSSTASYAVGVADGVWGPQPALSKYAGTWSATMTVLPSVQERPLTLCTTGLRAIGDPTLIPPSDITFDPPQVPFGVDTFTVSVSMGSMRRRETLIFQGEITAVETGGAVTDPVRANNRDSGPVR